MVEFTPPDKTTFIIAEVFEDAKEYPLFDSFWFFFVVAALYLLFILKIGPAYMKNREPYQFKNTIVIYNAVQVLLSLYYTILGLDIMLRTGLIPKVCCVGDPKVRDKISYFIYIYALGKITELLDTIFFVLRKKDNQVTFLHVYHHSSVVVGTFAVFKWAQSHTIVYCAFINSVVHVVMYFYYGVSALGPWTAPYLTWKKHITNFQRVQFLSMILHMLISLLYTTCTYSIVGIIYVLFSAGFFFILFTNFYMQSYKKKKAASNTTADASAESNKPKEQ